MQEDYSFGVVPLTYIDGVWSVFLVRHQSGHWTLPKGHPEGDETPIECAKRELFEETGLSIDTLLFDAPLVEHYQFQSKKVRIHKKVEYFIATVTGEVKIQVEEIEEGCWLPLSKAFARVTYSQMRSLLETVSKMISKIPPSKIA